MAFTPISNDFIQYQAQASGTSAAGYFLKLYAAGTNTPISTALDSAGSTLVAKVELDSLGFAQNGSGGATTLYIDQAYRLVLYVNATDADANTFGNAVQDIDDIPQLATELSASEVVKNFKTLALAVADTDIVDGDSLNLAERTTGNGGGAMWDVVLSSTVTENTYNIVQGTGVGTLSLVLREESGISFATQWGVNDSNTAAVNTPILQALWDNGPKRIHYPVGDILVNKLSLPDATVEHIGTIDQRGAASSTILFNPSGTATDPVIELSVMSAGNASVFRNLEIDTNDTAQYGFYLASATVFQAIKNMGFHNIFVTNLKSGAVGWQIGDTANTGIDTDAWNHNFYSCHARGSTGAIGWVVDAQNAYNIGWYNCSNGRKDVSNLMLTGIKTIKGSGFRVYNFFGDKLQATGSPWLIDHNSGSMDIYGMNTEDHRCVKARTSGRGEDSLTIRGMQVNDATGDNATVIDSTMITSIHDSIFKTTGGGDNRVVTCTNRFYANNVDLGSAGEYDLTGEPRQNVIEGMRVGSLQSINNNSNFHFWVETGADKPPINWALNKGTGTATIQQSTSNANIGQFSTNISCSVANTGDVMGLSMSRAIPIAAYKGSNINLVAIATRTGTETMDVECLVDGVNILIGGSTVFESDASGGKILAWGTIPVPTGAVEITAGSLKVGLPSGQTGGIWIDAVMLVPFEFSGRIPALYQHIQSILIDEQLEGPKVNNTQMLGSTLWVDATGDLRILSGDRTADLDGTVVGTQT